MMAKRIPQHYLQLVLILPSLPTSSTPPITAWMAIPMRLPPITPNRVRLQSDIIGGLIAVGLWDKEGVRGLNNRYNHNRHLDFNYLIIKAFDFDYII